MTYLHIKPMQKSLGRNIENSKFIIERNKKSGEYGINCSCSKGSIGQTER